RLCYRRGVEAVPATVGLEASIAPGNDQPSFGMLAVHAQCRDTAIGYRGAIVLECLCRLIQVVEFDFRDCVISLRAPRIRCDGLVERSEEHTSELQSLTNLV